MKSPRKRSLRSRFRRGSRQARPHCWRSPTAAATRQGASVEALLAEVHRQRPGVTALGCYLDHTEPLVRDVVRTLDGPAVAVPLLLTAAFHTGVDLPQHLAGSPVAVEQAAALGPHPLLLRALGRRLAEAGVPALDSGTAIVLAAAGSSDPGAVASVAAVARGWASEGWWVVTPAYVSAAGRLPPPTPSRSSGHGVRRVAVASYLLSPRSVPAQRPTPRSPT